MKPINFINPIPQQQQTMITRWYFISRIALFITTGILVALQIGQLYSFFTQRAHTRHAQEHCAAIQDLHTQLTHIKNETHAANEKLTPLRHIKEDYTSLGAALGNLIKLCTAPTNMLTCQCDEKEVTLTAQCPSPQHAVHINEKLAQEKWLSDVRIVSLARATKDKNLFTATIKAHLS